MAMQYYGDVNARRADLHGGHGGTFTTNGGRQAGTKLDTSTATGVTNLASRLNQAERSAPVATTTTKASTGGSGAGMGEALISAPITPSWDFSNYTNLYQALIDRLGGTLESGLKGLDASHAGVVDMANKALAEQLRQAKNAQYEADARASRQNAHNRKLLNQQYGGEDSGTAQAIYARNGANLANQYTANNNNYLANASNYQLNNARTIADSLNRTNEAKANLNRQYNTDMTNQVVNPITSMLKEAMAYDANDLTKGGSGGQYQALYDTFLNKLRMPSEWKF